jgi:hypothetical protein
MATLLDSKHIIWNKLYEVYTRLNTQFPNKIDVKVIKSYPKTFEDIDKNSAVITVSRVAAPEEYRFVGDLTTTELDNNAQQMWKQKGNLQTEHLEIAIWSLNAEYRDDIYVLTRQILFEEKEDFFRNYNFIKFIRLSGADQEIDVGQLPRVVYRGVHIYMATHLLQFQKAEDLVGAINCNIEVVTELKL